MQPQGWGASFTRALSYANTPAVRENPREGSVACDAEGVHIHGEIAKGETVRYCDMKPRGSCGGQGFIETLDITIDRLMKDGVPKGSSRTTSNLHAPPRKLGGLFRAAGYGR